MKGWSRSTAVSSGSSPRVPVLEDFPALGGSSSNSGGGASAPSINKGHRLPKEMTSSIAAETHQSGSATKGSNNTKNTSTSRTTRKSTSRCGVTQSLAAPSISSCCSSRRPTSLSAAHETFYQHIKKSRFEEQQQKPAKPKLSPDGSYNPKFGITSVMHLLPTKTPTGAAAAAATFSSRFANKLYELMSQNVTVTEGIGLLPPSSYHVTFTGMEYALDCDDFNAAVLWDAQRAIDEFFTESNASDVLMVVDGVDGDGKPHCESGVPFKLNTDMEHYVGSGVKLHPTAMAFDAEAAGMSKSMQALIHGFTADLRSQLKGYPREQAYHMTIGYYHRKAKKDVRVAATAACVTCAQEAFRIVAEESPTLLIPSKGIKQRRHPLDTSVLFQTPDICTYESMEKFTPMFVSSE